MDKKSAANTSNQNPKKQAGKNCTSHCKKCNGECSLNTQHNGPHRCSGGHNWS